MFLKRQAKEKTFSKKRRFDYARKNFENPFFKKQKRIVVGVDLKLRIIISLIIIVFGSTIYFFGFSSFWKIKEISIKGLERMEEEKILSLVREAMSEKTLLFISRSNSLFFSTDKLAAELIDRYHFEKLSIKKNIPETLEIEIKEKPFVCVWSEDQKFYYSDEDGRIMEEISIEGIDKTKYPIIKNQSDKKIKNSLAQVDPKYIDFILRLNETMKDSPIGFEIDGFLLDNEQETVKVISKEGPIIKFSTREGAEEQLEKFIIIRHEKLKDDFINKEYIDLRYGDKIYFQ